MEQSAQTTRQCPHCDSAISRRASVCPFCRQKIKPLDNAHKGPPVGGIILAVVCLVLFVTIVLASSGAPHVDQPNDWAILATSYAEKAVKRQLSDADSAKFETSQVYRRGQDSDRTVCGRVNAKNLFGGYVGFTPFVVHVHYDGRAANGDWVATSYATIGAQLDAGTLTNVGDEWSRNCHDQ